MPWRGSRPVVTGRSTRPARRLLLSRPTDEVVKNPSDTGTRTSWATATLKGSHSPGARLAWPLRGGKTHLRERRRRGRPSLGEYAQPRYAQAPRGASNPTRTFALCVRTELVDSARFTPAAGLPQVGELGGRSSVGSVPSRLRFPTCPVDKVTLRILGSIEAEGEDLGVELSSIHDARCSRR